MLKYCSCCGEIKALSFFNLRRKGSDILNPKSYNCECKDCKKARSASSRVSNRLFAQRFKLYKGCSICGYNKNPYALQFDHIDPNKKALKGGRAVNYSWSREKLKFEIRKCRVLCANCHMIETHEPKEENTC